MKTLLTALGLAALLAGCASHNNGMGGTSDQGDTMKTDSINSTENGGSLNSNSDSYNDTTSGSTLDNSNIRPAPNTQVTPMAK